MDDKRVIQFGDVEKKGKEGGKEKTDPRQQLRVKDENFKMVIADADLNFAYRELSDEESAVLDAACNEFAEGTLQPILLGHASNICPCRTMEMQARVKARMQLMTTPGPIGIELTQDDVDKMQFGIVVKAIGGKPTGVESIVTECKICGAVHIYGGVDTVTRALGEIFQKQLDDDAREAVKAKDDSDAVPEPGEFVMEDVDTGEIQDGGGDLGKALFGEAGNDKFTLSQPEDQ